MRDVLVSLANGAGVVRAEHGLLVTDNVVDGGGSYLREADRYHPVKSGVDQGCSVVGGLLPPGAVSAEAVDDRGIRVEAEVGAGAYAALIEQPIDGYEPIVCCRDAAGRPVQRPRAADYPSERVSDTREPCPACRESDWDEYQPFEDWRGGGSSNGGPYSKSPIVACRACGHEQPEGTFMSTRTEPAASESKEQRAARVARIRAELRKQHWLNDRLILRAADFPIYQADGWSVKLGGSGSHSDILTEITVHHYERADAHPLDGDKPVITVVTRHEPELRFSETRVARQALENFVRRTAHYEDWPEGSHAAITLFLEARRRATAGLILAAEHSEQTMVIEGADAETSRLTVPGGPWTVAFRHADLTIAVSGRDVDPVDLRLDPIADPAATLLGPEPPDS